MHLFEEAWRINLLHFYVASTSFFIHSLVWHNGFNFKLKLNYWSVYISIILSSFYRLLTNFLLFQNFIFFHFKKFVRFSPLKQLCKRKTSNKNLITKSLRMIFMTMIWICWFTSYYSLLLLPTFLWHRHLFWICFLVNVWLDFGD